MHFFKPNIHTFVSYKQCIVPNLYHKSIYPIPDWRKSLLIYHKFQKRNLPLQLDFPTYAIIMEFMSLPHGFLYPMTFPQQKSGREAKSLIFKCDVWSLTTRSGCYFWNGGWFLRHRPWQHYTRPVYSSLSYLVYLLSFLSRLTIPTYSLNYIFPAQKTVPRFHNNMALSYLPALSFFP